MKTINPSKKPVNPYVRAKVALMSVLYALLTVAFGILFTVSVVLSSFGWGFLTAIVGTAWAVSTSVGITGILDWLDDRAKDWRPGPQDS